MSQQTTAIQIINDDITMTNKLNANSIDLIVTSPPYNVGIQYNSFTEQWSHDEYLQFSYRWLTQCYIATKNEGRMCVNIAVHNQKHVKSPLAAELIKVACNIGWHYKTTIIWKKKGNKHADIRGSWCSAQSPMIIAPVEFVIIFYKQSWKKTQGIKQNDITESEFIDWTNGIWYLDWKAEHLEKDGAFFNDHPVPFPRTLAKRCIKLFSYLGDTVLDPFMGTGTTLVEAYLNKRSAIGIDIDKQYCQLAYLRCANLKKESNAS